MRRLIKSEINEDTLQLITEILRIIKKKNHDAQVYASKLHNLEEMENSETQNLPRLYYEETENLNRTSNKETSRIR